MSRILMLSCLGLLAGAVCLNFGQGVTPPGLTIVPVSTNQVRVTITNLTVGVAYEIYRRPVFFVADPWRFEQRGTVNQTNFVIGFNLDETGFFEAAVGTDWDGDGVANDIDAQPSSTNATTLAITIDSPVQGQNQP